MLGRITVKKKIYTGEPAQICVCLHIGKLMPLCKSSNTRHNIFNSIKYLLFIHRLVILTRNLGTKLTIILVMPMKRTEKLLNCMKRR